MKTTILGIVLVSFLSLTTAFAQQPAVFSADGKAIRGYDPVAYFTDEQAVKGDSTLTYAYEGATWQFASKEHLDAFKADPTKYVPQYGGYCAYGTADGHKAPTQPDAWTIDNGKLYLNYNTKVRTKWNTNRPGYIEKADQNWPKLKDTN